MDLTYRILWFEDNDEWFNTTSRRVARYIKEKNYRVEIDRIEKASDFFIENQKLQKYDLMIVDYKLEKISEQGKEKNIYGSEIIENIRSGKFVNDILFYSSYGYDVLNEIMKKEGLEGVFIADRDNGEFLDKVKLLIDKAVRRSDNLVNIRGIVMDVTSDFDNIIRDLIRMSWPESNEIEKVLSDKIMKKLLKDSVKTAEKMVSKYSKIDSDNIDELLDEREFSAIKQARLLSWCIESDEELQFEYLKMMQKNRLLDVSDEAEKFYDMYVKDIIKYRNALAHVKNGSGEVDRVIIGEIDGQQVEFTNELCDSLRKKMLSYDQLFKELYDYIQKRLIPSK